MDDPKHLPNLPQEAQERSFPPSRSRHAFALWFVLICFTLALLIFVWMLTGLITEVEDLSKRVNALENSKQEPQDILLPLETDSLPKWVGTDTGIQVLRTLPANKKGTKHQVNAKQVQWRGTGYDVYQVNLSAQKIGFHYKKSKGGLYRSLGAVIDQLSSKGRKILFLTNGGIYAEDYTPEGLFVENGIEVKPLNLKHGDGNFYMLPNGVFYQTDQNKVGIVESKDFLKIKQNVRFATQSGPLLLSNGALVQNFKPESPNKYIRNGVGINKDGQPVFVISQRPVNFYDFSTVFKQLGCQSALYLDGGISKAYIPQIGRKEVDGDFCVIISVTQ